jgi:hypothetical protein
MYSGQFEKRIWPSGCFGWLAAGAGVGVLSAVPFTLPQPAMTDEARASDPARPRNWRRVFMSDVYVFRWWVVKSLRKP